MIYLDHAAATPVSQKALAAMQPYLSEQFFNPSAPYLAAKHVREAYEAAKNQIAHVIGAKGIDLVITSGATESINLAFTVLEKSCPTKALVLATEHAAVLGAAKRFPHELIAVDSAGLINLADLQHRITDDVALISVSLANNELGTIQPLSEIAELIRTLRQNRLARGITTPLYLHSDASQAANLMDINVARMGVDLLTLNAAKCGGPKGVGALYLAHGVPVRPLVAGGGQERGLRSGTENVAGVMGFAAALTDAKEHLVSNRQKFAQMSQKFKECLMQELQDSPASPAQPTLPGKQTSPAQPTLPAQPAKPAQPAQQGEPALIDNASSTRSADSPKRHRAIPEPIFLGNPKHQLANFIPVCFPGIDAERLIYRLEQDQIYVSTGAACAANKGSHSHVLAAIGLSEAEINGSLRITLGSTNTIQQMLPAATKICQAVRAEYARYA